MLVLQRLGSYLKEALFCFKAGDGVADKWRLLVATFDFHLHKDSTRVYEARIKLGPLRPLIRLRGGGGDMFIFHEVLGDEVYDLPPGALEGPPQTIVDLGANIGMSTLLFASRFPQARIVCVEPHPDSAKLLRFNTASLGDRVTVVEAAIASEPGTLRLALANEHYNASQVRRSDRSVEVQAVTMDQVITQAAMPHIDLLKMDIEGAERLILSAMPAWLRSVGLILGELHDYSFTDMQRDVGFAGLIVAGKGDSQVVASRPPHGRLHSSQHQTSGCA